jgi:hypothetical protein
VIDEEAALGLIRLRAEIPRATIATLIKQMQACGISTPAIVLSSSTAYRLLVEHRRMHSKAAVDRRKFEAECVTTTCCRAM